MLQRLTKGPAKARVKINAVIDMVNKGVVLPTEDILVEQFPDGRVRLFLSAAAKERLSGGG